MQGKLPCIEQPGFSLISFKVCSSPSGVTRSAISLDSLITFTPFLSPTFPIMDSSSQANSMSALWTAAMAKPLEACQIALLSLESIGGSTGAACASSSGVICKTTLSFFKASSISSSDTSPPSPSSVLTTGMGTSGRGSSIVEPMS